MNPIIAISITVVIVAFMAMAAYKWLVYNINNPVDKNAFQIKAIPYSEQLFYVVEFYNVHAHYKFLRELELDRLILDSELMATRFTTMDEAIIAARKYLARLESKVVYRSDSTPPAL